jgi:MtfA peptidase
MGKIGEFFNSRNEAGKTQSVTTPVAPGWEINYSNLVSLYIPYYYRLPDVLKKKFLERTYRFRTLKNFHYVGMQEQAEIPVLVSAAAVQLTLGLEKFELSFFRDIYVTADAYKTADATEAYIGHVAPSGIYLSWKYFLHGFGDATDNVNVAIHEMAHALAHESFMQEAAIDPDFRADFARFSKTSGPEMAKWFVAKRSYLRPYAFTNFQEFWAVSVEAFFESPAEFKAHLPDLYSCLSEVLNQDPLSPNVVLPQQ